jgi:hypothetical protein
VPGVIHRTCVQVPMSSAPQPFCTECQLCQALCVISARPAKDEVRPAVSLIFQMGTSGSGRSLAS